MYFVAYKQIHFLPKPKDAVPLRPNLLEGTDFGRNLAAWTRRIGQVVSVSGEPQLAFRLDGRGGSQAYEVGLEQALAAKLKPNTLYALSFDVLAGQDVAAVVYVGAAQPTGEVGSLKGWASWWSGAGTSVVVARADAKGRCEVWFRSAKSSGELLRIEWRNYSPGYAMLHRPKLEEIADADLRPSAWCLAEADKIGQQGERGAAIRGPQMWSTLPDDYPFQSGGEGEDYHDIVIHQQGEQQFYYACTQSHTKAPDRAPSASSPFWAQTQRQELVATRLLLAEKALIRNLIVEELEAVADKGEMKDVYTKMAAGDFQIGQKVDGSFLPNFKIAMDEDGDVVLEYFKNGQPMGRIDADFFARGEGVSNSWRTETLVPITQNTFSTLVHNEAAVPEVAQPWGADEIVAHTFLESYRKNGLIRIYNVSEIAVPSAYHQRTYSPRPEPKKLGDGAEGAISGCYRVKTALSPFSFLYADTGVVHISETPLPPHDIYEYRRYEAGLIVETKQIRRRKM